MDKNQLKKELKFDKEAFLHSVSTIFQSYERYMPNEDLMRIEDRLEMLQDVLTMAAEEVDEKQAMLKRFLKDRKVGDNL